MNISEVARLTGLTNKAIRFYEEKGLIAMPSRGPNGYREYRQQHIDELNLIKQAKVAGFSLEECKGLISLYNNPKRRSAEIKARTLQKIEQLDQQLQQIQTMRNTLAKLAERCPGDDSSSCPIMQQLINGDAKGSPSVMISKVKSKADGEI